MYFIKKKTKEELLRDNYFSANTEYNYRWKCTLTKGTSSEVLYSTHQPLASLVLPLMLNKKGYLPVTSDLGQYVSVLQSWEMIGILPVVLVLMDPN